MEKNRFKEAVLEKKEFIYTLELVPGRGSRGKTQDDILRMAEQAAIVVEMVTRYAPELKQSGKRASDMRLPVVK